LQSAVTLRCVAADCFSACGNRAAPVLAIAPSMLFLGQ